MRRLEDHLSNAYIPLKRHWMVLFPEGGFLRKRLPISQRFAAKNNLPVMKNVTLPRMGALFVIRNILMSGGSSGLKGEGEEVICNNNNNGSDTTSGSQMLLLKDTMKEDNNYCVSACKLNGHTERQLKDHQMNGKVITVGDDEKKTMAPTDGRINDDDADDLEFILDITIGYPDGEPLDLLNIIHGLREPCETVIYYRLYSTKEVSSLAAAI